MKIPKSTLLVTVGLLAGASLATGASFAVSAGASSSPVTYYGCVSETGTLSKVGTKAPTCPNKSTVISWNSVGPQGPRGLRGPRGAQGAKGPGAQSTYGELQPVSGRSYHGTLTLALTSGAYLLSWAGIPTPNVDCSFGSAGSLSNVILAAPASDLNAWDGSVLIFVGTGGGSITSTCTSSDSGTTAEMTAVPTAVAS